MLFEIRIEWIDELLKWNATAFQGIDQILFPKSYLWFPEIAVSNSKFLEDRKSTENSYVKVCYWISIHLEMNL